MLSSFMMSMVAVVAVDFGAAPPPFDANAMEKIRSYFRANLDVQNSGAVLASPSQSNPDYYYHWQRDAAISMNVYLNDADGNPQENVLKSYVQWVLNAQSQDDPNGIDVEGEPKFYLNGKPYDKPWGRPQNDGSALRALTLISFAFQQLAAGNRDYVTSTLYHPQAGTHGIKQDLEYVAHHWEEESFDPWEEANGDHFFTRMVQRKALIAGAQLASVLNDTGASSYYKLQSTGLSRALQSHWNASANTIMESLWRPYSGPAKLDMMDSAVILGVLYGNTNDNFYSYSDEKVLASATRLINYFTGSFKINSADSSRGLPGILIGRYPGDVFDGNTKTGGNPWNLCTNAFGELYYRVAKELLVHGRVQISSLNQPFFVHAMRFTKFTSGSLKVGTVLTRADAVFMQLMDALAQNGDDYLNRVKYHVQGDDYHMNEELNKDSGYQQGAHDLTWSYGTAISAMNARAQLLASFTAAESLASRAF